MDTIDSTLELLRDWVWSAPLLVLLLGTSIYLTFLLKGVQFRYLGYAIKQVFAKPHTDSRGDISHFQALMTSLAGAIGTGTVVGVATGISIGGLGSIFWMWVTAFFGMATKYTESLLAVKYRELDERGEMIGGPMQYLERGFGSKWMAAVFAIFGTIAAIGTGNLIQVNAITEVMTHNFDINPWHVGIALALLTGLVIVGGVKSIGNVAGILVPFMALFYVGGGLLIILTHFTQIPTAFAKIFSSAFTGSAAFGGFAGATIASAIQMGVARSIISSEAGLGISSMAAAAAQTDTPGRQAMITMTGTLLSTVIICSITGLVLAVTGVFGAYDAEGAPLSGASMALEAFNTIPTGGYIVSIGLILFAFSTVIAWAYYGEKCAEYLFGTRAVWIYRLLFTLLVIPGAALKIQIAWNLADILNGLMAVPNMIGIIGLSRIIVSETDTFLKIVNEEAEGM